MRGIQSFEGFLDSRFRGSDIEMAAFCNLLVIDDCESKFRIPHSTFVPLSTYNIDQFIRHEDHPFDLLAFDQFPNSLTL